MKKIAFFSLGCKLNFSEISFISNNIPADKFIKVDFKDIADIYVINTCAVTQAAEKKCRNAIRQAYSRNPNAIIAVLGCLSQLEAQTISEIEGVKIVLGSAEKFDVINLLEENNNEIKVKDIRSNSEFVSSYSINDRTRSFLKIQDGCNNFCTYCTVPLARGSSRSDNINNVIENAKKIAAAGVNEIVLTGVNIGDFGKNINQTLFELLLELEKITEIKRLRLSSIEPDLLTDEIINLVAVSNKILPHFHIPLQSGCGKILKLMNRHYQPELFAEKVFMIKKTMPGCFIAADVIVGFPSETEDDFLETYNFINSLPVSALHVFTYSERKNTKAINIKSTVDSKIKAKRSLMLHQLSDIKKQEFYKANLGNDAKVLFESDNINGYMFGFTGNYIKVKTKFNAEFVNQIVDLKLNKIDDNGLFVF